MRFFDICFSNRTAAIIKGVHDVSGNGGDIGIIDGGRRHEAVVGFAVHFNRAVDALGHALQQDLRFFVDIVGLEQWREHGTPAFALFAVAGGAVGFVNLLSFAHQRGISGKSGWEVECGQKEQDGAECSHDVFLFE